MIRRSVLADTSIWIDHIAKKATPLAEFLRERRIVLHPLVVGEIAMGSLRDRKLLVAELNKLPKVQIPTNAEVMAMVEWERLFGTGIGFVDAHLLAAVKMTGNVTLLTKDGRLREQAERMGIAFAP